MVYFWIIIVNCKPVLESADENFYLSEKEGHIRYKQKTVFKIGLS
jgi:hypothetical protein